MTSESNLIQALKERIKILDIQDESNLMDYIHEEIGNLNTFGDYVIFDETILDYENKRLLVVERAHKLTTVPSVLIPGFQIYKIIDLKMADINGKNSEISRVKPIPSMERSEVGRFLRRNDYRNCNFYFLNNEIEPVRREKPKNVVYDNSKPKPPLL